MYNSSRSPCFQKYTILHMSAHVLLNLLNMLGKSDKMQGLPTILWYHFFATSLINSIIQEHEMLDSIYHDF